MGSGAGAGGRIPGDRHRGASGTGNDIARQIDSDEVCGNDDAAAAAQDPDRFPLGGGGSDVALQHAGTAVGDGCATGNGGLRPSDAGQDRDTDNGNVEKRGTAVSYAHLLRQDSHTAFQTLTDEKIGWPVA